MNASFFVQPPEGHAALLKFVDHGTDVMEMQLYAFTDRSCENMLLTAPFSKSKAPAYLYDGDPVVVSWVRLSIADEVRLYHGKLKEGVPYGMEIIYDTPGQLSVVTTAHDIPYLVAADAGDRYPPLCGDAVTIGEQAYRFDSDKVATGSGATCHVDGAGCRYIGACALCGNATDKSLCATVHLNSPEVFYALLWGPYKPEDLPASEAELSAEVMVATELP